MLADWNGVIPAQSVEMGARHLNRTSQSMLSIVSVLEVGYQQLSGLSMLLEYRCMDFGYLHLMLEESPGDSMTSQLELQKPIDIALCE